MFPLPEFTVKPHDPMYGREIPTGIGGTFTPQHFIEEDTRDLHTIVRRQVSAGSGSATRHNRNSSKPERGGSFSRRIAEWLHERLRQPPCVCVVSRSAHAVATADHLFQRDYAEQPTVRPPSPVCVQCPGRCERNAKIRGF